MGCLAIVIALPAQDAFAGSLRRALKSVQRGSRASVLPHGALGPGQLVEQLEVHPELRTCSGPVAETQRGVGRDAALAVEDAGEPVDRNLDLARDLRRCCELLGKMLARMNDVSAGPRLRLREASICKTSACRTS